LRVIDEVELMEISIVTFPANSMAGINQIKQQSLNDTNFNCRELEELSRLVKKLQKI
jgi:phage head maturation protease